MTSAVKRLFLKHPRLTLAVAESVTCGHLQAQIGAISGASKFFVGGITAYTLDEKVRHLGVSRAAAKRVDCVSERVAGEMAKGACRLFRADIAVATTGYAEGVKVPFLWWGLYDRRHRRLKTGQLKFAGCKRVAAQARGGKAVLGILEKYLRSV